MKFDIPTSDPLRALDFCQRLARSLGSEVTRASAPKLSIVLPVYNEVENLNPLASRLTAVLETFSFTHEIIFVDDGSTDGSADAIDRICASNSSCRLIVLSRNFGHQAAIAAGLEVARGDAIVVMDSDLQDEPEIIPRFVDRWLEGYQVVYATRRSRPEPVMLRTCYKIFYRLLAGTARIDIPRDAGDFCLLTRQVLDAMKSVSERRPFLRGLRAWAGFRQIGVPVDRSARAAGNSKYKLKHLIALALDGLVGFSVAPLRLITLMGVLVSAGSLLLAVGYFVQKITVGLHPPGFATIVVLCSLLAGVQLLMLGIVSEYVGRVLDEVKGRPRFVVARTRGWEHHEGSPPQ